MKKHPDTSGNNGTGIIDIEDRQNFDRTIVRSLSRKLIDETDLVQGIYNIYSSLVKQSEWQCENPECDDLLLKYDIRIVAAIEKDGTLYKIASLPEEIMGALIDTNRKVLMCLTHDTVNIQIAGEMPPTREKARVLPISRARVKNDNWRKKPKK